MGKSSSSCLKIIACGSDTATASDDDAILHQTKGPGDKRGWSFRKKSGRHRVLGNNVTSKTTNFADKETPQAISADFLEPVKSTTSDEKPQLPDPVYKAGDDSPLEYVGESKTAVEVIASENDCSRASEKPKIGQLLVASDNERNSTSTEADEGLVVLENGSIEPSADLGGVTELVVSKAESDQMTELKTSISQDGSDASVIGDELVAIVVQSSIRGFLARQGFFQLKNVVTLQAAIRGYLVRRNAVETLHCIQGIAKVQALVRAQSSKSLDQNYKKSEGQFSTAKLLKNSFARQLLESTPKSKSVGIRCDPLTPNSAWAWLERWMSVSTTQVLQTAEPSADIQDGNQAQSYHSQSDVQLPSISQSDSSISKITMDEMTKSSEGEGNRGNHVVELVDSQLSSPIFTENQQSHHQMAEEINEDENSMKMDAHASVISVSHEIQQPKLSAKRSASEELNGEGKKIACGSSTFSNSDVNINLPKFEPSIVRVDGSECGTELSVTSTLDSPARCEVEIEQPETEVKNVEPSFSVDGGKGQDCLINDMSSSNLSDLPSETIQQEEVSIIPVIAEVNSQVDQKSEMNALGEPLNFVGENSVIDDDVAVMELKEDKNEENASSDHATGVQASPRSHLTVPESQGTPSSQDHLTGFQASPRSHMTVPEPQGTPSSQDHVTRVEASPRSHLTVPESQGTPSSKVSVNKKRNRIGKSGSDTKPSSRSAGKRSPSNPNLDSGARTSVDNLPKDNKSGKRRNSFGSVKSDNDLEPRETSSHSSLPSYMQATKSAKAKAHSPRSSPDVHDKEVTSKKRQSLPTVPSASGRQGSPRVQRSSPEAAQGAKGNASNPSNERKWQR